MEKCLAKQTFSSSAWVKPTQNALKEKNAPARMTNLSSAKVGASLKEGQTKSIRGATLRLARNQALMSRAYPSNNQ